MPKRKRMTEKTRRKIGKANSISQKGKRLSEETRKKISRNNARYFLGKRFSKEHREKLSIAAKGKPKPWFKGRKFSDEHKRKLSKSHKGQKPWMENRHHSEETKRKISEAKKGVEVSVEAKRNMLKGQQKRYSSGDPTSIEKKVYDELKARGLLFETQKLINGKFIVDAYIPSLNLVIEADGDYWHSLEKTAKKDKSENAYLKTCGFNLLRLTEREINDNSFKGKLDKLN